MMIERTGWLLDVYADPKGPPGGVILWLLGEDERRYRLRQSFPITFYAAGPAKRLRSLWRYLESCPLPLELSRDERRDLFTREPLPVLVVRVPRPAAQPRLFRRAAEAFPDLTYYDADIQLALRHAAAQGTFPLARCTVVASEDGLVHEIQVLDEPWDLDPLPPPLRILRVEPDADPARRSPRHLLIQATCRGRPEAAYRLALAPERPLLVNLRAILKRHDPDLLLTTWGDTWLLPHLLTLSRQLGLPLPLNRDPGRSAAHRPERSYFSYGQVIYRGRQVHLFGRWHIDCHNATLWNDYELEGALETARVTGLPPQTSARTSPGTGISAMQMLTALRLGVLVPWHKQQAESPKTALEMFAADQGGLVYQPLIGLHRDVAEIDFVSMYPGVIVHFNISPETVGGGQTGASDLEKIGSPQAEDELGLVPLTLKPLLEKRVALKKRLMTLSRRDARYKIYKARSSAHKWLLVTCFGYLGYKNARFGRIESHEAVTAYGREALLRAKEAAEERGFTILHMYIDGLWVRKPGASSVADFQPLLEDIAGRTGIPILLEGIYRWVAFPPSRLDERVPVANRYFGVFQDGTVKVRGVEARRHDTPPFISAVQKQILGYLVRDETSALLRTRHLLRRKLLDLRGGRVPLQDLLVTQKLSRELEDYRVPSPAARAATQLESSGKPLRAGQQVRFLYLRGEADIHAWDLPGTPHPAAVDTARYTTLLLRAAHTILEPFGVTEANLTDWVLGDPPARQLSLPSLQKEMRWAAQSYLGEPYPNTS